MDLFTKALDYLDTLKARYDNPPQPQGLEHQLKDIAYGDNISLSGPSLTVAGYIVSREPTEITLSHESPFPERLDVDRWQEGFRGAPLDQGEDPLTYSGTLMKVLKEMTQQSSSVTPGDRTYRLAAFETCIRLSTDVPLQEVTEGMASVKTGDLLYLVSPRLRVSGFAVDVTKDQVVLSHEFEYTRLPAWAWEKGIRGSSLSGQTRGDRPYNLPKFSSMAVLGSQLLHNLEAALNVPAKQGVSPPA